MSNWEYKVISSGRGGFASPALMEKFINDLGQDHWEIISFQQPPDNPLAFTGLARRSTQRDWTLEDAAKAVARAEADKLRAEFEAKFKAATGAPQPAAAAEEQGETFLSEERSRGEGDIRRLRDTSRDDDPDSPEEEGGAPKDDWEKLAAEDELPTFFEALRPHMRRNQRGPGMSVGLDFLAKKWRLEESDLKTALVECGMQIPADENAKPVYVEFEGELYWVNINRRGEIWINLRDKPEPVFRIVPGKRLESTEEPSSAEASEGRSAPASETSQDERAPQSSHQHQQPQHAPREDRGPATPKTLLDKIRGMMRRNRRGNGLSGSFPFLTKALKTSEADLLAQLAAHGLKLTEENDPKPAFHEEGDFLYWMNKNQRGEIWINARKERRQPGAPAPTLDGEPAAAGESAEAAPGEGPAGDNAPAPEDAPVVPSTEPVATPAPAAETASTPPPAHVLAAVRLLLQPKKRGEGVTAQVPDVAAQLNQSPEALIAALASAGLNEPADEDAKPTFGEHDGEIFWLNRSAKGDLWINAKASKSSAKKSGAKAGGAPRRTKKKEGVDADE